MLGNWRCQNEKFSGNSGSTSATAPQHRSPAPSTASLGRTAVDRLPTKILPLVNWTLCELFQPPYFTLTPLNIDNKKHMWPDSWLQVRTLKAAESICWPQLCSGHTAGGRGRVTLELSFPPLSLSRQSPTCHNRSRASKQIAARSTQGIGDCSSTPRVIKLRRKIFGTKRERQRRNLFMKRKIVAIE